jgi:hypothetical protein
MCFQVSVVCMLLFQFWLLLFQHRVGVPGRSPLLPGFLAVVGFVVGFVKLQLVDRAVLYFSLFCFLSV